MNGDELAREFEVMQKYLATLEARVAELEARTPPEPWLDKKELGLRLGCKPRWIEYRVGEGMPHERPVNKTLFQLSKVLPWLEEHGFNVTPVDIGERMNQPNTDANNGAAPRKRPAPDNGIGGSDVQAA